MTDRVVRYGINSDDKWYLEERGEIIAYFDTKEELRHRISEDGLWPFLEGPWGV